MSVRKRKWQTSKGEYKEAWLVDYTDQAGNRRSKQFARKKDADAWLTRARFEIVTGVHTPDSQSITVAEAGALWITRAEANALERSTLKQYEAHKRLHIDPYLGLVKLSRLTTVRLEQYLDILLATRSRAMAKKVLRSLTMILSEARRRGLIAQNVARDIKIKGNSRDKSVTEIPSNEEIREILNAASEVERALLMTLVMTGLRSSELRGLRWRDIDFELRTISISQRADNWATIGNPKSRSARRTIPLPTMLISELTAWRKIAPFSSMDLVFPNGKGNPQNPSNLVQRILNPIQLRAGVTKMARSGAMKAKYSPHAFRHAAASRWIKKGADFKRIQKWMGHENVELTLQTYGHLIEDRNLDMNLMESDALDLVPGA